MSFGRASSRAFGRGRGRGGWRGASSGGPLEVSSSTKPLGPTIDSIDCKTLLIDEDAPTIEDAKYVASYNWLSGEAPVMLVPGKSQLLILSSKLNARGYDNRDFKN